MENVIQSIYTSCDPNNADSVPVLTLIEYIKPYTPNHLTKLYDLQTQLDPQNSNPCISFDIFNGVMSTWVSQIKADNADHDSSEGLNNGVAGNFNGSLNENIANMSLFSSSVDNVEDVEEQLQKLQYIVSKTTSELDIVKKQLASSEEQNEQLISALNELQKCAHKEQQQYQERTGDELANNEKLQDMLNMANKQMKRSEKKINNNESQLKIHLNQISQLESQNVSLKEQIQKLEALKLQSTKIISDLEDSLQSKESDMNNAAETMKELKTSLDDKCDLINFYSNETKFLKQKSRALEKLLHRLYPDGSYPNVTLNDTNQSFYSVYNTPKLLNQLANPISPTINTPNKFGTSSPILINAHSDICNYSGIDLFSTIGVVIRTPHKSIKDEISEVSPDKSLDREEVQRLHKVVEQQDQIKSSLWESMKHLSNDNDQYKSAYEELQKDLQEKDTKIAILKREIEEFNDAEENNVEWEVEAEESGNKVREIEKVHKGTETEQGDGFWNLQRPITACKGVSYAKQQLRFERLLEKNDSIEKNLARERRLNVTLSQEKDDLRQENSQVKENLEVYHMKTVGQESEIYSLSETLGVVKNENEGLARENLGLKMDIQSLDRNLQNAMNTLAMESSVSAAIRGRNEHLVKRLRYLEQQIKEGVIRQAHLETEHLDEITKLEGKLAEKTEEVRCLRKQLEVSNVELFLSISNSELESAASNVVARLNDQLSENLVSQVDESQIHSLSSLEKDLVLLNNNVKVVTSLLEVMTEKCLGNVNVNSYTEVPTFEENYLVSCPTNNVEEQVDAFVQCGDFSTDEDSFVTCLSQVSSTTTDLISMVPFECDSFLDSLELNDDDLRNLTINEMEKKFATMAVTLTVDVSSASNRYRVQQELFHELVSRFFSYLNHIVEQLERPSPSQSSICNSAIRHLRILKNISDNVFQAAVQCGVQQYEKRTINCWKLIINYVAALNRNKRAETRDSFTQCQDVKVRLPDSLQKRYIEKDVLTPPCSRARVFPTVKFVLFSFFAVLVLIMFMMLFYVDRMCSKNGKIVCPIESILRRFIQPTFRGPPIY